MTKNKTNRPAAPEHLDGESLLEWERIIEELDAAGTLDTTDRAVLTVYAETWQAWKAAAKGVAQHGSVIKYSNGMVGPSPFYKVMKETGLQLRGLLNDLKLTPASRCKATDAEADDLEI